MPLSNPLHEISNDSHGNEASICHQMEPEARRQLQSDTDEDDLPSIGCSSTSGGSCTSFSDSAIDGVFSQDDNASACTDPSMDEMRSVSGTSKNDNYNSLENLLQQPSIHKQIIETAYELLCAWIIKVQSHYVELPTNRLTPPHRSNTTDLFTRPGSGALLAGTCASPDSEITSHLQILVPAFKPQGYFHLACPFFAADPCRHLSCLLEGKDLQSIPAVLCHIKRHHLWDTPYCPRCGDDFANYNDSHAHILHAHALQPNGGRVVPFDAMRKGIRPFMWDKLNEMDQRHGDEGEAQRWRLINSSLFRDSEQVASPGAGHSPYLNSGIGFAVSLVYDFWFLHCKTCVLAALVACGHTLRELDVQESLAAHDESICKELIGKLYHEYRLDDGLIRVDRLNTAKTPVKVDREGSSLCILRPENWSRFRTWLKVSRARLKARIRV